MRKRELRLVASTRSDRNFEGNRKAGAAGKTECVFRRGRCDVRNW